MATWKNLNPQTKTGRKLTDESRWKRCLPIGYIQPSLEAMAVIARIRFPSIKSNHTNAFSSYIPKVTITKKSGQCGQHCHKCEAHKTIQRRRRGGSGGAVRPGPLATCRRRPPVPPMRGCSSAGPRRPRLPFHRRHPGRWGEAAQSYIADNVTSPSSLT
jgi:hypothetical protein